MGDEYILNDCSFENTSFLDMALLVHADCHTIAL